MWQYDKYAIDDVVQTWRSCLALTSRASRHSHTTITVVASETVPGLESCTAKSQFASKQNELSSSSGSEDNIENVKKV